MRKLKILLTAVVLTNGFVPVVRAQYAAPAGLIRHQPENGSTVVHVDKNTGEEEDPNAPGSPTAFVEGAISDLLARAKSENKLLFVDCYTQWCGPCKAMAKDVFPLKRVGNLLNEKCVCVKLDMETAEGKEVGKKYDVHSYPTMLFLNGDGELVYRLVGYRPSGDFIREVTAGLKNSQFLQMKRQFQDGERGEEFLQQYLNVLRTAGMQGEVRNVVDEILAAVTVDDLLKSGFYTELLLGNYGPEQPLFREAYKRRAEFVEAYNERQAADMDEIWSRYPAKFTSRSGDEAVFDQNGMDAYINLMKECGVASGLRKDIVLNTYMSNAVLTKDSGRLMELTLQFMKTATPQSNARALLGASYTLEETVTDGKQRAKLAKAMKKYVKKNLEGQSNVFPNNHYIVGGKNYSYAEYHLQQFNGIIEKLEAPSQHKKQQS